MKLSFVGAFLLSILFCPGVNAQKVLSYPFAFLNTGKQEADNAANFLTDKSFDNIVFVLHDSRKADYIMTDRAIHVLQKFTVPFKETIFNEENEEYLGGTGIKNAHSFSFVYRVTPDKDDTKHYYKAETVNFDNKTVARKDLFEQAYDEKTLAYITDYGDFYLINANDKASELVIHRLSADGVLTEKHLSITIPAGTGKGKNKLSEYFADTKPVKDDEESELESASKSSKLFSFKDHFTFVVNDGSSPTHILNINKESFALTQKFIDHSNIAGSEKGKAYVNSFLFDDKIFSLVLNKKTIQIAICDVASGHILKLADITEENYEKLMAAPAEYKERQGKKEEEKDVEDYKSLLKALTKGTEGVLVTKSSTGQYVLTIGTYDPIIIHTSNSPVGTTSFGSTRGAGSSVSLGNTYATYSQSPGTGYSTTKSNYYKTTSFKLLLDSATLNIVKGKAKPTTGDQVRDFINERSFWVRKQFAVGDKQYFGVWDRDAEIYTIENIPIKR